MGVRGCGLGFACVGGRAVKGSLTGRLTWYLKLEDVSLDRNAAISGCCEETHSSSETERSPWKA